MMEAPWLRRPTTDGWFLSAAAILSGAASRNCFDICTIHAEHSLFNYAGSFPVLTSAGITTLGSCRLPLTAKGHWGRPQGVCTSGRETITCSRASIHCFANRAMLWIATTDDTTDWSI